MENPPRIKVKYGRRAFDNSDTTNEVVKQKQGRTANSNQNSTSAQRSSGAELLQTSDLRQVIRNSRSNGQSNPRITETEADGMKLAIDADEEQEFASEQENPELINKQQLDRPDFEEGQITDDDEQLQCDEDQQPGPSQVSQQGISLNNPNDINWLSQFEDCTGDSEIYFNFNCPQRSAPSGPQSEAEAMQFLETNPHLNNVFKKLIKQGIQEEREEIQKGMNDQNEQVNGNNLTSKPTCSRRGRPPNINKEAVQSPSDTIIYAPALRRANEVKQSNQLMEKISNFVESIRLETIRQDSARDPVPPIEIDKPIDP